MQKGWHQWNVFNYKHQSKVENREREDQNLCVWFFRRKYDSMALQNFNKILLWFLILGNKIIERTSGFESNRISRVFCRFRLLTNLIEFRVELSRIIVKQPRWKYHPVENLEKSLRRHRNNTVLNSSAIKNLGTFFCTPLPNGLLMNFVDDAKFFITNEWFSITE